MIIWLLKGDFLIYSKTNQIFIFIIYINMRRELFDVWIIDDYGNKIYLSATEKILIKLKERWERRVLALVKKNRAWEEYIEMEKKEKHIFHKNNSRWFNYSIISNLPKDMDIVVKRVEYWKYYKMKVGDMLQSWNFLHFLLNGYEKQYFVPMECFEEIEIKKDWN